MDFQDDHILEALKARQNDAAALTDFAISCVNELETVSALQEQTRKKLYDAFVENVAQLFKNLRPEGWRGDPLDMKNYKNAYYKLQLPDYSEKFSEKLFQSFSRTILKSPFKGEWAEASLEEKIDFLDEQAFSFLNDYDPENAIHGEEPFNQKRIVFLCDLPAQKDINTHASHQNFSGEILMFRYLHVFFDDNYIQNNQPDDHTDYKETSERFNEIINSLDKKSFTYDKTRDEWHRQYNEETKQHFQLWTNLEEENTAKALLVHELAHYVTLRMSIIQEVVPDFISQEHFFTQEDVKLYKASRIAYEDTGPLYRLNKEEVLAHKLQDQALSYLTAPQSCKIQGY